MKKSKFVILFLSLVTAGASMAQSRTFVITDFGAKPDGVSNNTLAIQKAIDMANALGGGKVLVPRGRFVTGVIQLKSNVELNIHEEAVLLGSTNREDYGPALKASALIVAAGQKNIAITGKGLIDGQCDLLIADIYRKLNAGQLSDNEWKQYNPWHQRRPSERNRPRLIDFRNCEDVTIKNVRLQNATSWVQNYKNCSNVLIDSINVFSNTFLNNDGIDLVDCYKARVTNCIINAADDGICLKSESRNSRCEDIYVANCRVRSSANAVKLGTASRGGFKNVVIKDIFVYDTFRSAIAIEAVDGGSVDSIDVRNIRAVNTGNAIFIRLGHRNTDSVCSQLKNVYIGNMKVQVPAGKPDRGYPMDGPELREASKLTDTLHYSGPAPWSSYSFDTIAALTPHHVFPSSITGLPGHKVEHVKLENIEIVYEGVAGADTVAYIPSDALATVPEVAPDYPEFSMFGELPAWGIYARHVAGLELKNVSLRFQNKDKRCACVFDDVSGLMLEKLAVPSFNTLPVLILKDSEDPKFINLKLPADRNRAITIQ